MNRIEGAWVQTIEMVNKKYPNLNILQLGCTVVTLGGLRSSMGHEYASDTMRDYVHIFGAENTSKENFKCIDFLEREIFRSLRSKLDISKRNLQYPDKRFTGEKI